MQDKKISGKWVIARFQHETNTFSPIPTPLEAFNPYWDQDAFLDQEQARTAMGAFIQIALQENVEIITPICAFANPSGIVDGKAYERICNCIVEAVEQGCDAVLLDLHGAMVSEFSVDGEGDLLKRIKSIAPHIPIAVALDLHANVTPAMIENSDVMVSFKTYPHIDMFETGLHAGRLLRDMLLGKINPKLVYRQLPLLSHTLRSNTNEGAMQDAVQAAIRMENTPGILGISILAGFSLADFRDAGMSVIVIADEKIQGAIDKGNALANHLQERILLQADGFIYESSPVGLALKKASEMANLGNSGPVLLLDHSDNVMSGGPCDTTDVLESAFEYGLSNIAAGPFADPETVQKLIQLGLNKSIEIELGNKSGWTYRGVRKHPLKLTGLVKVITDGKIKVTGPIFHGSILNMGPSVLFETDQAQIVISSERVEPYDLAVMTSLGINLSSKSYVLLKSRMYCRPVFFPLSKGYVECDSDQGGPTSSNYDWFDIKHIRRPIYPLDKSKPISSMQS
jgi:microcystin degradation protein MlrC